MRRRVILRTIGAGLAGSAMVRRGVAGNPAVIADDGSTAGYDILVGGPRGGRIDRWARASALGMRTVLSPHEAVYLRTIGGQDGVTGANRLQTLVVPNGYTAAMLPGETSIAFLAGDPRVHFQPGGWIQVMAGLSAALLILRGGLGRLSEATPIRLAAASPESPDLAALLAFQRLGVSVMPIFGLRGAAAVARAFAAGEADAVLLTGEEIPADAAPLAAEGGVAVCTLGVADGADDVARDPLFPHVPTVHEVASGRGAPALPKPLDQAYRAVAAASRIDFMLVLPHLTIPAKVAIWRQAALAAIASPALRSAAAASAISLTADGADESAFAPLDLPSGALLALREFLFQRFGWRPS